MEKRRRNLDEQRRGFSNRIFLATPLAGIIVWLIIGVAGVMLNKWLLCIYTICSAALFLIQ